MTAQANRIPGNTGKKTVWIPGASGGIGSAVALLFAQNGFNTVLQYCRSEVRAQALAAQIRDLGAQTLCLQADATRREEVFSALESAQKTFGTVDVLCNCVGSAQQKLFCDISDADYDGIMDVNVRGVFLSCQAVLPQMIQRKQGKIISISSMWGVTGASCEVHYSAAKAAVIGMTRALARELAPSNIQINCIAPGIIDTPMNEALPPEMLELLRRESPTGRFGKPEEVAALALFLAGEAADFITGQVIGVDGGFI